MTGGGGAGTAVAVRGNGEVAIVYGVNSNTGVNPFGGPWTSLALNFSAFGQLAWQRLNVGSAGVSWAVPGNQAWAAIGASFGSTANPTFTNRASGTTNTNFSTPIIFTAGKSLLFAAETETNNSSGFSVGVSDTFGNSWVPIVGISGSRSPLSNQLAQANFFFVANAIGGSGTLNITRDSQPDGTTWIVYEIGNLTNFIPAGLRLLTATGVGQ